MQRKTFTDEVRETYTPYGKFDCRRSAIMYTLLMNGIEGDESTSDGDGEWIERYGRNILMGDNQGFVSSYRYDNEQEAIDYFIMASNFYNEMNQGDTTDA